MQSPLLRHWRAEGQGKEERRPFADFALHPQVTAVRLDQAARDGQAQPGALRMFNVIGRLDKRLKDAGLHFLGDARTCIHHGKDEFFPLLFHAQGDAALLGEFDGVGKQVQQHLADAPPVTGSQRQVMINILNESYGLLQRRHFVFAAEAQPCQPPL